MSMQLPDLTVTWRAPFGMSWTPTNDTGMQLHAHALRSGDDVWLIDPVDGTGLDELLDELGGTRRHVLVLLDRHQRDAAAIARRHGAQLHVVDGTIRQELPAGTHRIRPGAFPGTPFEVIPMHHVPKLWNECALWWPEHRLLVFAEAIGSSEAFRMGTGSALAVHPMLRLTPPRRQLADVTPDIVLTGHGRPVTVDAAGYLQEALAESRRRTPAFAGAAMRAAFDKVRSSRSR